MYKQTLEENLKADIQYNNIRSYNHEIYSILCSKTGLSNYENKRYYQDNYNSLPYGHFKIHA